jgi:hypothetical protein
MNLRIRITLATFILLAGITGGMVSIPEQYHSMRIDIVFTPSVKDFCRIFYDTGKGFSAKESVKFDVHATGWVGEYAITLPPAPLKTLRIDPIFRSDEFGIRSIRLSAGAQFILLEKDDLLRYFRAVNLMEDTLLSGERLLILRKEPGQQPRLISQFDIDQEFSLRNFRKEHILRFSVWLFSTFAALLIMAFSAKGLLKFKQFMLKSEKWISGLKGDHVKAFVLQNRFLILFTFGITYLVYGFELFGFSLSIDEEVTSFGSAPDLDVYLRVGRWGIYLLNYIIYPHSILPYYPFLIAISAIALCSVLFAGTRNSSTAAKLVFTIIFVTHPLNAYYLAFNTVNLYYGLGMALTVISFLLFEKALISKKKPFILYLVFTALILAFAVSLYQAMIPFFLVFASFLLFRRILDGHDLTLPEFMKSLGCVLMVVVLAIGIYKGVDITVRHILLGKGPENQQEYLENMVNWGVHPAGKVINDLFQSTGDYLRGTEASLDFTGWSSKVFLFVVAALVIVILAKRRPVFQKVLLIGVLFMLVLSPFSLNIANGKSLPVRTLMAFPLMMALVWMLLAEQAPVIIKRVIVVLAFALLLNHFYWNTRLFYASYTSWQADKVMAARISERIMQLDISNKYAKPRVAFVGKFVRQRNTMFFRSEVLGASFFEWGKGNPFRIKALFRTIGIEEMDLVMPVELKPLQKQIAEMPAWPRKGSVALFGDIVVVKLSEEWDK